MNRQTIYKQKKAMKAQARFGWGFAVSIFFAFTLPGIVQSLFAVASLYCLYRAWYCEVYLQALKN